MVELTLGEFSKVLEYLIGNNRNLTDKGDTPIAVCLEGDAGIGKTAVVQQTAEKLGMTFIKVNLAQIEEPAELVGYPYKEYKVKTPEGPIWISSDLIGKVRKDQWAITNETRMSYATPAWLPREENPNGTMLVLDDFSRANTLILQAIMEIINTGSYLSWSLPKHTNIILTSNPDNSKYSVQGLDDAQKSRMITFNSKFDVQEWAQWAERFGVGGRAINFALLYSTELFTERNHVTLANARSYTTFCRSLSSIADWSKEESLSLILQIASGCFNEENNILGNLFTSFIHNKLDKLLEPGKMVNDRWETVSEELHDCVYQQEDYRADIAGVLGIRLLNFCDQFLGKKEAESKKVEALLINLVEAEPQLLTQDIMYNIVKTLCTRHATIANKWLMNKSLREVAL
jgi:hypothetical protein|uniref:AAA ATPase n=1 Tax=Podoviridae sp. ctz6O13 TaxID=2827757 RepID=A0A8S5TK22_9CAUD|nr:MAG TPA: AAA ATPase [Podoviridae sp. ctz6O13]